MALNNFAMFLLNDGTVKSVGENSNGQLGLGNITSPITTITDVSITNVKQISCGGSYTLFLLNDGTVKCVGSNSSGELGLGNTTATNGVINAVPSLTNVKQIACGYSHTVFLLNNGTVKAVGHNQYGQLGLGNTTTPITTISDVSISNVKQISCGYFHTLFLLNDGTVKCVGSNSSGELGLGNTTATNGVINAVPSLTNVKQIACGSNHTMFLLNDGTVKSVGYNTTGQLGLGNTTATNGVINAVPSLTNVKQIACGYSHTIFLLNDGTVKSVGRNDYGQLGLRNTTSPISTISNVSLTNVKQVACGYYHTVFLLNDGTVKSVGSNQLGQLGLGNTTSPITTITNVNNLSNVNELWKDYYIAIFKYLIKKGSAIYSIKPEFYGVIGYDNPTENDFLTKGVDSLDALNATLSGEIVPKNDIGYGQILVYKN